MLTVIDVLFKVISMGLIPSLNFYTNSKMALSGKQWLTSFHRCLVFKTPFGDRRRKIRLAGSGLNDSVETDSANLKCLETKYLEFEISPGRHCS